MAKFYGEIGYVDTVETSPGVWTNAVTKKNYSGDVVKDSRLWRDGEGLNDNLTVNHRISIVADPFAYDNLSTIRYVRWMGANWKVTKIDIQRPRLLLTIGEVYNG